MLSRRIVQFSGVPTAPEPQPGVTKTVGSSGADFLTIQAALSWFQSNHNFDINGIARIQIIDVGTYSVESTLNLDGIAGTPSINAYLEVTSNAANPTVAPIINMSHTSNGGFFVDLDYTWIHNLWFENDNTGSSTEVIRVHANNVLINRSVLVAFNQISSQDGIYVGNWEVLDLRIDHLQIAGFGRAAIQLQSYIDRKPITADIDFVSVGVGSVAGTTEGGAISMFANDAVASVAARVYNTLGYDYRGNLSSSDVFNIRSGNGSTVYNGSHNIAEDTSAEINFTDSHDSVVFTESAPGSGKNAWLTEINDPLPSNLDLSIAGENAFTVTQNGVSRVGSEPDPRQEFDYDILWNPRDPASPDIGAYEFQG